MFSKTLFKQSLIQNWKLWLIITIVTSAICILIINTFDPHAMRLAMMTFGDAPPAGMGGGPFGTGTSRFGMLTIPDLLASGYYAMLGLIMPLVYVVVTSNSLMAGQVDRGSMAYTISSPLTRVKVAITQIIYLVVALASMFLVVAASGLAATQISHNGLWGANHTPDVVVAAGTLGISNQELEENLHLILDNPQALATGAETRGINQEAYAMYVELLILNQAIDGAAEIMDVSREEFMANPSMMEGNDEVARLFARLLNVDAETVKNHIEDAMPQLYGQSIASPTMILVMMHGLDHYMENMSMDDLMIAAEAAAIYLEVEALRLMSQLQKVIDSPGALAAASEASGVGEQALVSFINIQIAEGEFEFDQGIYFNMAKFINLNIGIFLLMLAISGVSFMFSCIFNSNRNSLAFGAGIPAGFFILNMMANASPDFVNFRYFTINTLYSPMDIVGGEGFGLQFALMGAISVALYAIGTIVFKKRDLPL